MEGKQVRGEGRGAHGLYGGAAVHSCLVVVGGIITFVMIVRGKRRRAQAHGVDFKEQI
jgi:hypothetical protein